MLKSILKYLNIEKLAFHIVGGRKSIHIPPHRIYLHVHRQELFFIPTTCRVLKHLKYNERLKSKNPE